jgi:hypothetical protein
MSVVHGVFPVFVGCVHAIARPWYASTTILPGAEIVCVFNAKNSTLFAHHSYHANSTKLFYTAISHIVNNIHSHLYLLFTYLLKIYIQLYTVMIACCCSPCAYRIPDNRTVSGAILVRPIFHTVMITILTRPFHILHKNWRSREKVFFHLVVDTQVSTK